MSSQRSRAYMVLSSRDGALVFSALYWDHDKERGVCTTHLSRSADLRNHHSALQSSFQSPALPGASLPKRLRSRVLIDDSGWEAMAVRASNANTIFRGGDFRIYFLYTRGNHDKAHDRFAIARRTAGFVKYPDVAGTSRRRFRRTAGASRGP